jgi:PIN domain nuclease of toxin-antitoxin system
VKLLLDTCTFLWFLADAPQLSKRARAAILDPGNSVYLSAVSGWEIGRKYARGELELPARPETLIPQIRSDSGILSLPLVEEDAISAEKLPLHHRDSFDRMIIAQALMQGMVIVTPDPAFGAYTVRLLW